MYYYVTRIQEFGPFITALQKENEIYLDTETTGLDPFVDKILLLQVQIDGSCFIFDVRKLGEKNISYIIHLINGTGKVVNGFNLKFDLEMIATNYNILLTNVFCTMLAEILITNGLAKSKERFPSLASLAKNYCGITLNKEIRKDFYTTPEMELTEEHLIYAAQDVACLEIIKAEQLKKLQSQKQIETCNLEMLLLPVVCDMELNGAIIDKDVWMNLGKEAQGKAVELGTKLLNEVVDRVLEYSKRFSSLLEVVDFFKLGKERKTKAGRESLSQITSPEYARNYLLNNFNVNSSDQMLLVLREVYGIQIESTNEKIINKFVNQYPIINVLIDYREQQKKVSSFSDNFLEFIHPVTGRVHTTFNQLGAQSGRFSSSKPNLQNIPKESQYRRAFVAAKGNKIIAIDFDQEELRLLAKIASVSRMIESYKNAGDIHTTTAAGIYNKEEKDVTTAERRKGKSLNFAVVYGSTEWGLWKNFGIPLEEGKLLTNKFYKEIYPEINHCKHIAGKFILENGYSTTLNGRKRFFEKQTFFPGGDKEHDRWEASILREGFNHIVQGTGADIMKESLCRIFYENPFGDKLQIILQVYDEIVCEVAEEIAQEAANFIGNIMLETEEKYLKNVLPAKVETSIGDYWVHG